MSSVAGGSLEAARAPMSTRALCALGSIALLIFSGLVALGSWQLERRAWKLDLIDRVQQRVHALPVAAPGRVEWPRVSAARDEYRRVRLSGSFLHEHTTKVQASTVLGVGHWLLTPLRTADGSVVLINRGFVASRQREPAAVAAAGPAGTVSVTGLLRVSEPGGFFLRRNDPAAGRWHSRDVEAIAAARGLSGVAPYFIDAAASLQQVDGSVEATPIGGLTVTDFPNNHLVYALTWYALALMVAAAAARLTFEELRLRRAVIAPASARTPGLPDGQADL